MCRTNPVDKPTESFYSERMTNNTPPLQEHSANNTRTPPVGIVVAGLKGGSGKSIIAVGLAAAFSRAGKMVVPFKKGPDYIDAGWLQLAAAHPCYNLDPFLMERDAMLFSFREHAADAEIIIVEGNRGLFDGVDAAGTYSTAELAQLLGLPVILVVDCTKTTRTVAALVLGCRHMALDLSIAGVVLNQLATSRQERIIREAVGHYAGLPVLGAIPRLAEDVLPQRHLGVTPFQEHANARDAVTALADLAGQYLDIPAIEQRMTPSPLLQESGSGIVAAKKQERQAVVRLGVIRDAAFQFYYPENLEALVQAGAELVTIDALTDHILPDIDGLYIGGGFPETNAKKLSANDSFRQSVREAAQAGLPIYAECGGLIFLGEGIVLEKETYPLAGVFPVFFAIEKRPQAHGYTILTVERENPFFPPGTELKGHEFRYSRIISWEGDSGDLACRAIRGVGFMNRRDGLVHKNVLALYTHIHAVGTPAWAGSLVQQALKFKGRATTAVVSG